MADTDQPADEDAVDPTTSAEEDLIHRAWGIIANAHAAPITEQPADATPGWSDAAVTWRNDFHAYVARRTRAREAETAMLTGFRGYPAERGEEPVGPPIEPPPPLT